MPDNNQLIFSTGFALPLASHFADPSADVGIRFVHPITPQFGCFVGAQGIFGGDTSLGECTFGFTWTPGK